MTALRVTDLCVNIAGHKLVDRVSFMALRGQILGLVGPSGSGKSLTLFSIVGLLPHGAQRSGCISVGNDDISALDDDAMAAIRGRRIGFIFQEPMTALHPLKTVGAQIGEILAGEMLEPDCDAAVAKALTDVELPAEFAARYPHQLSGGQRQRVVIAMAIVQQPEIVFADEPTSALDSLTQVQIVDLLKRLVTQHNMALILITHDLDLADSMCDRIVIMQQGQIVESCDQSGGLNSLKSDYARNLLAATRFIPQRTQAAQKRPVLDVQNISAAYDTGRLFARWEDAKPVLRDISFTLHQAETLAVIGPSGCGKTTLARVLLGLHPMTDGQIVRQYGDRVTQMQMVFQDPFSSLNPRHTVGDIVTETLWQTALSKEQKTTQAITALGQVGLSRDFAERYPHQLSGGQRQRVSLARALISGPDVIILDEALSALDATIRAEILALLVTLQKEAGFSYLFISHDITLVHGFADRLMVMEQGCVVEAGATEQVFAQPQHALTQRLIAVGTQKYS